MASLAHVTQAPSSHPSANLTTDQPGRIELTLAPETLGRLHFDMRPEGAGLSITLSAERAETLDLMRRHLPELAAELKQLGIQAGSFSFGGWSDGRQPRAETTFDTRAPTTGATPDFTPPAPVSHRPMAAAGALDLRI
ncbi:flagellar hook-length control protein FliK [Tabrizicola oligotrophica]|uniref:Flagellar hook-length control protein FliK n=1 Tax=Tabrizicola oligotrophica TaxID=2710650 RepID=A0A6M0QUF6_9RHOB|nr:flagellar hook-length control protein FliK [Tabrizicola oligotrophica]NEY91128.1 flagellar hook-length control protein FliK [Tabrizicola oligotrophica]